MKHIQSGAECVSSGRGKGWDEGSHPLGEGRLLIANELGAICVLGEDRTGTRYFICHCIVDCLADQIASGEPGPEILSPFQPACVCADRSIGIGPGIQAHVTIPTKESRGEGGVDADVESIVECIVDCTRWSAVSVPTSGKATVQHHKIVLPTTGGIRNDDVLIGSTHRIIIFIRTYSQFLAPKEIFVPR